jgi:predicted amidophosphoribosyltransferase
VKRRRGWEHIDTIAGVMAFAHGVPVLHLLRRRVAAPQKALGIDDRSRNLRGAISVRGRQSPRGLDLVLLDDLITTGATAGECSRVLLEAGARRVDVLAIAIDL